MGCFHNVSGVPEWCLSTPLNSPPIFQPSEFQPSSLPTTLLSLLSSLLRSTSNSPFQFSFSRWTSLPQLMHIQPPRPHIHHPLHPCPAQSSYRVPGRNPTGMGHAQGRVFTDKGECLQRPRFQCSCQALLCRRPRSFKNKVEERSGGLDWGVADG